MGELEDDQELAHSGLVEDCCLRKRRHSQRMQFQTLSGRRH